LPETNCTCPVGMRVLVAGGVTVAVSVKLTFERMLGGAGSVLVNVVVEASVGAGVVGATEVQMPASCTTLVPDDALAALVWTVRVPVLSPPFVGVNNAVRTQVAPAARLCAGLHSVDAAFSLKPAPAKVKLVMVRAALPGL
jgi:hypothetical protein